MLSTGTLFFAALFSFVAALNCSVDLAQFYVSFGYYFQTVQCDDGCNECVFFMNGGEFESNIVECLPNVPCSVQVTSDESVMNNIILNGSLASALTVNTSNTVGSDWYFSRIYAPANGGDFRFEITNSGTSSMKGMKFYAANSGVMDIIVRNSEMRSIEFYGATAEELKIRLDENVVYGYQYNSTIQCPSEGKCVWQSNGQRYDANPNWMAVVNLIAYPGTDLQLVCDGSNSKACGGIEVHCNNSVEYWCEMQYFAAQWQCVGSLDLSNGCPSDYTTTATPTTTPAIATTPTTTMTSTTMAATTTTTAATHTTTAKPTTTTTAMATTTTVDTTTPATTTQLVTPQPSDSGFNGWNLSHVFSVVTVVCLFL